MIDREELSKMSDDEIRSRLDETEEDRRVLAKEEERRLTKPFDHEGEFVKITNWEDVTYMLVRSNFLTDDDSTAPVRSKSKMLYQGVGFSFSFGDYDDNTWFDYSHWAEVELIADDLVQKDEHINIEIITREEFEKAFAEAHSKIPKLLSEYLKENERSEADAR